MKKIKVSEDWASTIVGWFIILLVLFQLKPTWPKFNWSNAEGLMNHVLSLDNLGHTLIVFGFFLVMALLAGVLSGKRAKSVLMSFPVVFVLGVVAMMISGNEDLKSWGLETVIFSLLLGLFISNIFHLPDWLKKSLSSELFVKIGLVILGTTVLFDSLVKSGLLGIIQSVIVVFSVWYFSYFLCKKMGIDDEMNFMLSSAVSICGVSAAVATAGAIKGDEKKLSFVVSLVMIVAVPMIFLMPFFAKLLGLSEAVAGAWIGGTIDTTGAVVATGSVYGETARQIAVIVKSSQNVLLGIAAFAISLYWSYRKKGSGIPGGEKTSGMVIWQRFPKFVLGFIAASLVFSFLVSPEPREASTGILKNIQGMWFSLAFVSIGLETNFRSLFNKENKKATGAFVIAQTFNVIVTLIVAYLLFSTFA